MTMTRLAAAAILLMVLLPLAMLGWLAAQGSGALWPHLVAHVVPDAAQQTLLLLGGVALVVTPVGAGCAWLVASCDFPLRRWVQWLLPLPLAVPTYIVAYAYLDLLHPIGPLQSVLRSALGITDPRHSLLPDPRSLPGCILLLGFVLYPYVYLSARAAFLMQSRAMLAAARSLGATGFTIFRRVVLPLAWPGIAVGLSLALLETLNDIGAAEYLGVRTLTLSVYVTWTTRSSPEGAAQIALVLLMLAALLAGVEQLGRRRSGDWGHQDMAPPRRRLSPVLQALALLACLLPVLLGFLLPAGYLARVAFDRVREFGLPPDLPIWVWNSVLTSGVSTLVAVALGLLLAFLARREGPRGAWVLRLASLGYAVPGTVLALGLLLLLGKLDGAIDSAARQLFGFGTGLLFSASGAALVYAYVARFLAIPAGGLHAGYGRLPRTLDAASQSLGAGAWLTVRRVHLPALLPALGAAALLTFIDAMKELPATLLLRPLNVETLATFVHGEAARGTYEDGAIAALLIVFVGMLPILVLGRITAWLTGRERAVPPARLPIATAPAE